MNADAALLREQAMHIHRNMPTGIIGGYVVACLLVAAFWPVGDRTQMSLWLLAGAVLGAWRLAIWRSHRGTAFTPEQSRLWLHQATLGAGLSGCIWGMGTVIFFGPHEFLYHLVFVYAVAMMGVTAMFSFAPYTRTFKAFFLPTTIPAVLGMAVQGSWLHFEVALGVAIFVAVTLNFYANFNRMFIRSVQLGFENKMLVDELTVQKEAAESANLAKSRFLAAASHDLRQPMHALTLYLGAMEGQDLQDATRGNLAHARQCAQTMDGMFRALLDISRLDAGAVKPEPRNLALGPLLERIGMEFAPQAAERGLAFRVRPCKYTVWGDPDMVERILRNLIANAIRHTERGGVLVGCRPRGGMVRIAVSDTGPGIAPEERRRVFEEFYQIGNPERDRSKGIGLGLAIVERLGKLLGAPLTLSSKVGRGSMFAIDLLRGSGVAEPALAAAPAVSTAGGADDLRGRFVVVVDDEEEILAATREVLEKWQCTVLTAGSGAQAMERLASSVQAPDLLICDYRLRDHETGIDVIEALRTEFNADIPALLVSGDSAPARMREAEASGLRVLHKPFNDESLRLALGGILAAGALHSSA